MEATVIPGVLVRSLKRFSDARGWLMELFREDELPDGFRPAMGYLSVTKPGVARGPHEHVDQTDGFAFLSGSYRLYLWENRPDRAPAKLELEVGEANPVLVLVPPGVVHAYKNVGDAEAFVLNVPNRLYAGRNRAEPVDEIRHEADPASPFRLD
ncbi:MAG: dTDP-4-dehydrorhamnose 3,5-epimerase family protein [Fimbriimonadaceae bacterium]|nr:dTDP-4-dehydrorhamnose 3,5-epimerase family protein [Fimbriimonadaceae bacterium]